jgi:hypothetical protein
MTRQCLNKFELSDIKLAITINFQFFRAVVTVARAARPTNVYSKPFQIIVSAVSCLAKNLSNVSYSKKNKPQQL